MTEKMIIVEKAIFEAFPDFKRGVVIVDDMKNEARNSKIASLLEEVMASRRGGENWLEHEFIKAWEEAHRKFGSNPNRFPPSIKALIKRIQKGGRIPFINSAVALFNYISIKYLIPCGGDDADKVEGNMRLGFATGKERFLPLGGKEEEHPEPGEVIYFDDKTLNVMCRRWNWRNGDFSKITESTRRAVINLDGIGPVSEELILKARDELAELFESLCGARLRVGVLKQGSESLLAYA